MDQHRETQATRSRADRGAFGWCDGALWLGTTSLQWDDLSEKQNGRDGMNEAEMKAELERLRAENAKLKSKDSAGLSLKVSEKGAVSLYGMGRFPVTLYKEQWLRILASASVIEVFIQENDGKLKTNE